MLPHFYNNYHTMGVICNSTEDNFVVSNHLVTFSFKVMQT